MVGAFLREAAVLIIVFFPMDRYFEFMHEGLHPQHPTISDTIPVRTIVEISVTLLAVGIILEKVDFGQLVLTLAERSKWGLRFIKGILAVIQRLVEGGQK